MLQLLQPQTPDQPRKMSLTHRSETDPKQTDRRPGATWTTCRVLVSSERKHSELLSPVNRCLQIYLSLVRVQQEVTTTPQKLNIIMFSLTVYPNFLQKRQFMSSS